MKNILSKFDRGLLKLVGEKDFSIIKKLSNKDKQSIIKAGPHIMLANRLHQCFWIGNNKHKTLYVNPVYSDVSGYSLEECLGKSSDFCFDKESKKVIARHHKLRNKGRGSQYEGDITRKDGGMATVLVSGTPTKDGGTMGIFTNLRLMDKLDRKDQKLINVIGRKDFEILKSTLNSKDLATIIKYRQSIKLANTMDYGFWIGGKTHKTLYANRIYQKTTEYSLKECMGKPSDFCFDKESKKAIVGHHKLRKIGLSSKYEATYCTKSGEKIPVLVVGAPTEAGGTYGVHINLTNVKKLTKKEKIAEQIIRDSREAIVILDTKRKIKMWNTGAKTIFRYKEEDVLNKKISDLIIPPKKMEENKKFLREVEKKNFIKNRETQRWTKNGKMIDVSLSVSRVTDEKNKVTGYLVFYQDITHQKKVDTELQKRFEAIQDAYKELGFQRRQADYIYEIIETAVSNEPLEGLARLMVSATSMITKCDATTLRLYNKKKMALDLVASLGVTRKWTGKGATPFKDSLYKEAFENKRPIIIHDIGSSGKYKGKGLIREHEFKTLILIPLMVENKFIGALSLYAKDPGKFRLIETDFLEKFGKQCSLALFAKISALK